jgi:hypothetical protein
MNYTFAALSLITLLPLGGLSGDDKQSRNTLKGVKGLEVLIERLETNEKAIGLSEEDLQTDVELKLRQTGILIGKQNVASGQPVLYVSLVSLEGPLPVSYFIKLELCQDVTLSRNGADYSVVPTWSVGTIGRANSSRNIRDILKDLIDKFLNAYLSVNPKH